MMVIIHPWQVVAYGFGCVVVVAVIVGIVLAIRRRRR